MFICTNTILWANGEILDFSSIEHFLFICTKICLFVLILFYRANGEILDFSSIEHFLFVCTKICSFVHTILWANGKILDFSSIEHFFVHLHYNICSLLLTSILPALLSLVQSNIFCSFPLQLCSFLLIN